jgi:serine O-acetyltransferase
MSTLQCDLSTAELGRYVARQLEAFFPDGQSVDLLQTALDPALERLERCIASVRLWRPGQFDYLHSSQYCTFLYFLARELWLASGDGRLCNKLFALNKALNGLDLFYQVELPDVFFIGHSVGIVLAKASYASHMVFYQNCMVGKNHGRSPVFEPGVILYPHSAVIGGCHLGREAVVAQGASLIDANAPAGHLVFRGEQGQPCFKPSRHRYLDDYFRDCPPSG